ncbi:hypothetical protein R3P38DRAFT_2793699 [Favolaschia claudopus]|uniref:Uncharacterized protein n=1 Tax=Favolaschia claudopus TaxID=2862362 RepID=A0AAW0ACK3_9AGAR
MRTHIQAKWSSDEGVTFSEADGEGGGGVRAAGRARFWVSRWARTALFGSKGATVRLSRGQSDDEESTSTRLVRAAVAAEVDLTEAREDWRQRREEMVVEEGKGYGPLEGGDYVIVTMPFTTYNHYASVCCLTLEIGNLEKHS